MREEVLDAEIQRHFARLTFSAEERAYLTQRIGRQRETWAREREAALATIQLEKGRLEERLRRLTDGYVDGVVVREVFLDRQATLLRERKDLEERHAHVSTEDGTLRDRLAQFLELAGSVATTYDSGLPAEKREFLRVVTSNRVVDRKSLAVTMALPFRLLAERAPVSSGPPFRNRPRTLDGLFRSLVRWFTTNPAPSPTMARNLWSQRSMGKRDNKDGDRAA